MLANRMGRMAAALIPIAFAATLTAQTSRTIPAGANLEVRSTSAIDAKSASEGRTYPATFNSDVMDTSGNVAIPRGSDAQLVVRKASNNELVLDLQSVRVNGRDYVLQTGDVSKSRREGVGKNKRTGEMVGGGAALGGIIGAIAGGGKGAAIGAATGAAAGAATQTITRGSEIRVPAEGLLTFKLEDAVHLTSR